MKSMRFFINRAKGFRQEMLKNHPNISEKVLDKFVKSMQTETYVFDCHMDENGTVTLELFDVKRNKLHIGQQEVEMRNILNGCTEYVRNNGNPLPTAVTGCQIITE